MSSTTKANGTPAVKSVAKATEHGSEPSTSVPEVLTGAVPKPKFDPARLRLSQDFADSVAIVRPLISMAVRRPGRTEWFRVHPTYVLDSVGLYIDGEDREHYLLDPGVASILADNEYTHASVYLGVNRQKGWFLWPVRRPATNGRADRWALSSIEAVQRAKTHWTRMSASMASGAYDVSYVTTDLGEVSWPVEPFERILEVAFGDRFIDQPNHPILRRLRGEE